MADPVTMSIIGLGLSAGSSILGGIGTMAGASAGGKALRTEAALRMQIAKWEKAQYERQAQEALGEGAMRARERNHDAKLLLSTLQARAAASGAGSTNPTVYALLEGIAGRGEELASYERMAAGREARTLKNRGAASILEAGLGQTVAGMRASSMEQEGRMAGIGSFIGAGGSLLSGLARVPSFGGGGGGYSGGGATGSWGATVAPSTRYLAPGYALSGGYRGYR